jgi:hypothetical protein
VESEALMNSSTQFDYDEIKQAWQNYRNESLEIFHYGFELELEKIAEKKEFKDRLGVSNAK